LRHGAAPSLPEAYRRAVDGMSIGPGVGSCGTAAFDNRQVIVSDIATDPLWAEFRKLAARHGLRACWSTPIRCGRGNVLGTFAIYYRNPRHPSAFEMEVIERATHVVRIAIERSMAEENLRRFHAELEKRVEERTLELQAANRELESFSYSVSHDLRAPLRAMGGFSRMVLEDYAGRLDEEGRRMLGVIHSEAGRMGRLIDDLLAFSRLVREPIEPVWIDMETMARDVFDELAARSPERRLRLVLHKLPPAFAAEAMIRQVWVNLISNAIKFTRVRDAGEIGISASVNGDGGRTYHVKDNGAGFDPRHAGKLFGIFQRLHSQQDFPGTGVGLALVQRIIQRHGGRIWAEAEVDRGATFHFSLPNPES
jgi:signal transduction histidine kinase